MAVLETTKRLSIRNFQPGDWEDLLEIAIDKAASPDAIYDHQFPTSEAEVKKIAALFAAGDDFLAVAESNTGRVIGYVHLGGANGPEKEFGYSFHSKYRGKGYALEACSAVIDHGFRSGAERLIAGTANLNHPSVRLLVSLGFRKMGEAVVSFSKTSEGQPIEFVGSSYLLERKEWLKRGAQPDIASR